MTDIYPLAIRYAAELSTMFDDVRQLLEELRGEEKDIPAPALLSNSPCPLKKTGSRAGSRTGSPTTAGKVVKVCIG